MSYSAGWTQVLDGASSAGHYRRASQIGATATFTFDLDSGTVRWGAVRGPTGGRADVAIDGVFVATVDLYAPSAEYWFGSLYTPQPGRHTLRVSVRGDAHPAATGAEVTVDFFEVAERVGGRGMTLGSPPASFSWSSGTAQTGYLLARLSQSGAVVLPASGTPLPRTSTSYTDPGPLSESSYCYVLLAMRGTDSIGHSDLLCLLPNLRTGIVPQGFSARLNESSNATLSWLPPTIPVPELAGYVLVALGGTEPRTKTFAPGVFTTVDDTQGSPRCYILVAISATQAIGNSDAICVVPGLSQLGTT